MKDFILASVEISGSEPISLGSIVAWGVLSSLVSTACNTPFNFGLVIILQAD